MNELWIKTKEEIKNNMRILNVLIMMMINKIMTDTKYVMMKAMKLTNE